MRTHFCGELSKANLNNEVKLCGWVNRRRDHGGVIFLDVRDKKGIAQVVIDLIICHLQSCICFSASPIILIFPDFLYLCNPPTKSQRPNTERSFHEISGICET